MTMLQKMVLDFEGPGAVESHWTDQQPQYVMFAQDGIRSDQFVAFGGPQGQCTFMVHAPWTELGRMVERLREVGAQVVRMARYPLDYTPEVVDEEQPTREHVLPPVTVSATKTRMAEMPSEDVISPAMNDTGMCVDPCDTSTQPPVRDILSAVELTPFAGTDVAA